MNDESAPFITTKYTPSNSGDNQVAAEGGKKAGEKSARFPLVAFDDVVMSTTGFYLVKNLIPRAGLVIVWGAPKCGKSFWTFDLMMHIACGWDYRGLRVKGGQVIYCALEGQIGFTRRVEAYRRKHPKSKGASFHLMATSLDLIRDHKALIMSIRTQLPKDVAPAAVVIDTLNRSLVGSESSDEDMAAYVRAADAIRAAFDCVVIIVHHSGHNGDRPRGHSSLLGADDALIAVKRDLADNIVATIENAKDAEAGMEIVSRLVVVDVGTDEDDDAITSCVIEPVGSPAVKHAAEKPGKGRRRSEDVDKISRAIVEAYHRLSDGVAKAPGFGGKPVLKIETTKLRDEVRSRGFLDTDDAGKITAASRSHFYRAKTDLIAANFFIETDGKFWQITTAEPVL
jgi:AAA domain